MTVKELQDLFVDRFLVNDKSNMACTWTSNALGGELGEVQNLIKKRDYYEWFPGYAERHDEKVAKGKKDSFDDALEDEMGDTLYYLLKLAFNLDLDLEKVAKRQMKKLEKQDGLYHKYFRK